MWKTYTERERRRLSWRLRLGLGDPEELDEEEERELEEPERLEPDELEPLEEPELEPELLLEVELDLDLNDNNRNRLRKGMHFKWIFARNMFKLEITNLLLLLPVDALRLFLTLSRPLSLSPSLVTVFSLPRSFVFSSSFLFVGDGALQKKSQCCH